MIGMVVRVFKVVQTELKRSDLYCEFLGNFSIQKFKNLTVIDHIFTW